MAIALNKLLADIRGCRECEADLPLGPRPIVQAAAGSRVLIIGQAPGTKVHDTGVPWNDPSGDHLREWMGIDRDVFYDPKKIALMPMGFCYPGRRKGGDAPPRPECAPLWHEPFRAALKKIRLVILTGQYAHAAYLGRDRKKTLTATVEAFEEYLPEFFALPHPSWRSKIWMKKNPWFAERALPELRRIVTAAIRA